MIRKHLLVALIVFIVGFLAGSLPIKKWVVNTVRAEETDKETFNKYKQIIIEDTKKREKERETLDKEWHEGLQDIGRFQFHGEMPFILDTKKGHVWHFSEEATAPRYMGQALPWSD
jgi:hypothetical protein